MDDDDDDLITMDALTKFAEQQTAKQLEKEAAEAKQAMEEEDIQAFETAEDTQDLQGE